MYGLVDRFSGFKEYFVTIFWVEESLLPSRGMQHVTLKHLYLSTKPQGITSQKTLFLTNFFLSIIIFFVILIILHA
jgi:hypothetical protein